MLVLLWLMPVTLVAFQMSCVSKSEACSNGICKKVISKSCGGPEAPVIKCDANGIFSSYSLCAPGVCCSNIPMGITVSLLFLTLLVVFLAFLLNTRSPVSSTPQIEPAQTNSEPSVPIATVPPMHLITPYSASNPSYHPDPIQLPPSTPVQVDNV